MSANYPLPLSLELSLPENFPAKEPGSRFFVSLAFFICQERIQNFDRKKIDTYFLIEKQERFLVQSCRKPSLV
jgi:hypothetical protein